MDIRFALVLFFSFPLFCSAQGVQKSPVEVLPGDGMLANYFEAETAKLEARSLAGIKTAEDWKQSEALRREQLGEMLGLQPMPKRGDLKAKVKGTQVFQDIVVENVVFQSMPGLYVTANFYTPADRDGRALPTILYVCGHSEQKEKGVSFGNKTGYHHHGVWFAKHGYACLMIDTIQLGEIAGIHHGTFREGRWWWNARGYTPAGVEAWNGIRAIDYLATRPECDMEKIGVTGRSGGGAYSWYIAALDERVKVAAPVAGITSMRNHVVDGCVEGHCDCMFQVNTYRWDFPEIAALIAPRPLMIANTDKDTIFPLDGVVDVYQKTRRIYKLLGAEDKIGLAIAEGPHSDSQPLRTPVFHGFERYLKGREPGDEIDTEAPKVLDRKTLRVFDKLPDDEIVTSVDEIFVETAPALKAPGSVEKWKPMRDAWMAVLEEKCFRVWADDGAEIRVSQLEAGGRNSVRQYEIDLGDGFKLSAAVASSTGGREVGTVLLPVDAEGWEKWAKDDFKALEERAKESNEMVAMVAVRGVAGSAWTSEKQKRVHIQRRFMLLGTTLDTVHVWDIRRAIVFARELKSGLPLWVDAEGVMAQNALYASLFQDGISSLTLRNMPPSHRGGASYLNVLRYLDVPAALTMAAERCAVTLIGERNDEFVQVSEIAESLGFGGNIEFVAE